MTILRKLAAGVLVVALSSAIFFLLVSDKTTKRNLLRPTLEILGKQLFASVREDSGREALERNYDEFIRKAEASEIDQKHAEEIAARILNLSVRDSVISTKEAMRILAPEPSVSVRKDTAPAPPGSAGGKFQILPPMVTKPFDKQEFEERLKAMINFQRQLSEAAKEAKLSGKAQKALYKFQADSGLVVQFDYDALHLLEQEDRLLADQVHELEKKKWLQWQYELDQAKKRQQIVQDSLQRIQSWPHRKTTGEPDK